MPETLGCVTSAKDLGPIQPRAAEPAEAGAGGESDRMERGQQQVAVQVGHPAPDFKAEGYHEGQFKLFQLSEFRGKWVVVCFYPGDYTFVCPTEITAVAARYDDLKALNVEVLAFSTDSKFVHKTWQEDELTKMVPSIPFPMLSDQNGKIGQVYGVYDEPSGTDVRGRFIIDPDGVVQAIEILNPTVGRNVNELIRQIQAFQHVRASGFTEVTPAMWQPGDPTLRPGPDLVGNVWKQWKPPVK